MSTGFELFAVGPEVASLEEVAAEYNGGTLRTFGTVDRLRGALSTVSCTFHAKGAVVEDERCGWTLDLGFSFEGGEVSSITVYLAPRAGAAGFPMPAATLVAEVAAALGGSAFHRDSGARVK